jgi:hypothetical protein
MMQNTTVIQTLESVKDTFKSVMGLYWTYLDTLNAYAERIPETDIETMQKLKEHTEEVLEAINHDIDIFSKAINEDVENMHGIQDKLKINDIYKFLKQNG